MKTQIMGKMWLVVIFASAALQVVVRAEPPAADKKGEVKANREKKGEKGGRPEMSSALADMSAEDKAAMKKALQAVWENPEVMQARDEVKRATETFHQAIKTAVGKEDPRVAALVERMNGGGKSRGEWGKKRPGPEGRGGRPPMGRPPGGGERGPAGIMAFSGDFSKEEKRRLEQAREKAMESETFQKLQQDLRALLKQGEDLRNKRVEMFHQVRGAITQAMVEADPKVKPLLERIGKSRKDR